jgi:predicted Zn finger-like uncharacterized protein
MFTRCPNCRTTFRVMPAQLKARAGTVRCGQCHFVFNALDTLADVPASYLSDESGASESVQSPEELLSGWGPIEADDIEGVGATNETSRDDAEAPVIQTASYDTADTEAIDELRDAAPAPETEPNVDVEGPDNHREHARETELGTEPEAVPEPASITDYLAASPPHEPIVPTQRWPWVLGSSVALLALLLQLTYYYRIELAAIRPDWRPALLALCAPLNCDVPRPRHIDTVGIESSDLRPDPQRIGRLTLSATLRSKAPFAQEWPLLELTLTDVADRKLAVRHFAAAEYLPRDQRGSMLASGFPANGEIPVTLALDIGDLSAAGYRLYIFYP